MLKKGQSDNFVKIKQWEIFMWKRRETNNLAIVKMKSMSTHRNIYVTKWNRGLEFFGLHFIYLRATVCDLNEMITLAYCVF